MSEPTKEELIGLLDTWKHCCEKDCLKECCIEFKENECEPCFKAIRRLIENMDKWQKKAGEISDKIDNDLDLSIEDCLNEAQDFIEEIRDFGKEEK